MEFVSTDTDFIMQDLMLLHFESGSYPSKVRTSPEVVISFSVSAIHFLYPDGHIQLLQKQYLHITGAKRGWVKVTN